MKPSRNLCGPIYKQQQLRYSQIMKYSFLLSFFFILCCCGLQGRNVDSTLQVNHSLTAQFENDNINVLYPGQDGVFEVVVEREATEVFFQLVKSNNTSNTFTAKYDTAQLWSFKEDDNKTILKAGGNITFTEDYRIFGALEESFEEGILTFENESQELQYQIRIRRERTDFYTVINTIQYYGEVHEWNPLDLDTIYIDSSFEINMFAFFEKELDQACSVTYKITLEGAEESEGKSVGNIDFKNEHKIVAKYKATQANSYQGEIQFNYDCPQVNGTGFTVPVKYVVLENEHVSIVDPLLISSFLIPFIITFLIGWVIRYKRAKSKTAASDQNPPESGNNNNDKTTAATNISQHEGVVITNQIRSRVLDELLKNQHRSAYDSQKLATLREQWVAEIGAEMKITSSTGFNNKDDKMRRQPNPIKGRQRGAQKKDALINDLQGQNKVLLEQQKQDKATIDEYILKKEILDDELKKQRLKLDKYAPYPAFMEGYYELLSRIYQFSQDHLKKIQGDSIFYNLLDKILYVKTPVKTISPIFGHARKDEYFCDILKLSHTTELQGVDRDTFFNYFIKGRGFHHINLMGRLYAYSKLASDVANTRGRMIREGFDLEELTSLFEYTNNYLKQAYDTEIFLPALLTDHFQEDMYRKNNFSYLADYYSFNSVRAGVIYDVERIGFTKEEHLIQRAMVTYKN